MEEGQEVVPRQKQEFCLQDPWEKKYQSGAFFNREINTFHNPEVELISLVQALQRMLCWLLPLGSRHTPSYGQEVKLSACTASANALTNA